MVSLMSLPCYTKIFTRKSLPINLVSVAVSVAAAEDGVGEDAVPRLADKGGALAALPSLCRREARGGGCGREGRPVDRTAPSHCCWCLMWKEHRHPPTARGGRRRRRGHLPPAPVPRRRRGLLGRYRFRSRRRCPSWQKGGWGRKPRRLMVSMKRRNAMEYAYA